jgi:hypothetical protein
MPMYSSTEFNTTPHLRQQHYNPYNERAYSVQNVDGQIDVNRDNNMRHNMVHDSQAPQSATKETRMEIADQIKLLVGIFDFTISFMYATDFG